MKVLINDTVYDSNSTPIMITFTRVEKKTLSKIPDSILTFCAYPKDMDEDSLSNFIALSPPIGKRIRWESPITFGKYAGYTWKEIREKDPSYVLWCHQNIEWIYLSKDDLELIELEAETQRWTNAEESR